LTTGLLSTNLISSPTTEYGVEKGWGMPSANKELPHIRELLIEDSLIRAIFGPDHKLNRALKPTRLDVGSADWRTVVMSPLVIEPTLTAWLRYADLSEDVILILGPMLSRLTLGDGPHRKYGYLKAMNDVITRLCKVIGDSLMAVLETLRWIENQGFIFHDSRSLVLFIKKISAVLNGFQDAEYPPMEPRDMVEGMAYASVAYHIDLITYAITFDPDTSSTVSRLKPDHPDLALLPLATELFLKSDLHTASLVYKLVQGDFSCGLYRFWELMHVLAAMGMPEAIIRRVFGRKNFSAGLFLCQGIASGSLGEASVTLFLRDPEFVTGNHIKAPDLEPLAQEWIRCDKPCPPKKFWEIGGTADAWRAHAAQIASRSRRTPKVISTRVIEQAVDQTPTGHKRHHLNFRAPTDEPTDIDFETMCSELDVCACFPKLDEDMVRVVLVHGLLRTGDRLATATTLPSRNDKKLWSQVKDHVSHGSRKPFIKALRPLIDAHLISYTGGNYQLARKNARFPQANILLTQLWGLVAKHTS
jgi:hypothetical protein